MLERIRRGHVGVRSARRPAWRVFALAVVLAAGVGLSGCGQPPPSGGSAGDDGGDQSGGGETTSGTAGVEETTTAETTSVEVGGTPGLAEASDEYEEYVVGQIGELEERTEEFTAAVISGDLGRAKGLFGPTREPWERVEPVAAALGDYDPNIDARKGDVPDSEWRGFHRIERALWVENTTEGQEGYARQLREDVSSLRDEVEGEGLELEPVDLVTGSVELLNEVSAGKITGEEDRYSHTDLYDIYANVEGSEEAYELLRPEVAGEDIALANDVTEGFDDVYEELEQYRRGEGWVSYETLGEADRRALSQEVDALAEPLSRVGTVLEEG